MSPALTVSLVAALVLGTGAAASVAGDAGRGAELFEQCSGCHEVGQGARHGIGPHLNSLFGRRAATLDDFRYSASMRRAGTAGLEWRAGTLDRFLENPRAIASGTRMTFRGMAEPGERADLIAYLRRFSDNPRDIPEAAPTARPTDPDVDPEILAIRGDPGYGEYLAGECTTCHQADGGADGIPSITLWPEDRFVVAMHAYKDRTRQHPVMQMIAGRLGNEEIAALAAYFGILEE